MNFVQSPFQENGEVFLVLIVPCLCGSSDLFKAASEWIETVRRRNRLGMRPSGFVEASVIEVEWPPFVVQGCLSEGGGELG